MALNADFVVGRKLGFIGVGTMNSAIIEGILKLSINEHGIIDQFSVPIYVSPRGTVKVNELVKKHGVPKIHVCLDNQDVLNNADVIFLGVRPEQVELMLQCKDETSESRITNQCNLVFDARRHCIVNLISTLPNSQLIQTINNNNSSTSKAMGQNQVVKAVPLPGVQFLAGTTAITPPKVLGGKIYNLFKHLGTAIEVEEDHLPYFQAMTCMMGPFYQHCQYLQEWIYEKMSPGTEKEPGIGGGMSNAKKHNNEIQRYLVGLFDTLLSDPRNSGDTWKKLMNAQTKGGLNEQAMGLMTETKDVTHKTLDTILNRLQNPKI